MSKLAEFKRLEAQLAEQLAALDQLKNDSSLKREMEFETKLKALLKEYEFGLRNIINILEPTSKPASLQVVPGQRRPRAMKTFKNPHTGEVVQTKGGNHRVLNEWKAQYGADAVQSWLQ